MDINEKDLSFLNDLKTEEKIAIIKVTELIEDTRNKIKKYGVDTSLPYKMQLKSDIGEIERLIRKFKVGKSNDRHLKKLEFLTIKLRTEADNIFA